MENVTFAAMSKPGLPSGTRDFGPEVMLKRQYITGIMENAFRLFGFRPIETPALENLSTLTGKYGDEGDQLLFKILNNGDFLAKANLQALDMRDSRKLMPSIADRGLRYDLTVPLARFVVMNRNDITFPFKRYQIQPVWRADRPQRGRYREFWQCDADVVGSSSVINEVELAAIYDKVFSALQLPVTIRINHRKVFDAFTEFVGGEANLALFMQLIDKVDKIGYDGVSKELAEKNIANTQELWQFLYEINELHSNSAKLDALQAHRHADAELMVAAVKDITTILSLAKTENILQLDLSLARGLSYYTGCIFEVVPQADILAEGVNIGSLGGGGRYDNLTGVFDLKDMPGVGISFGLDRIYDMMEMANLFPEVTGQNVQLLVCPMDDASFTMAFTILQKLREEGIACEVYPAAVKLKKQLDYANDRKIPFAAIIGEQEREQQKIALKNLTSGEQQDILLDDIQNHLHLWQF